MDQSVGLSMNTIFRKHSRLLLACTFLLLGGSAFAQVTASISGRAEDVAGAGIEGATVTVTSLETGVTRVVQTEPDGHYRVLSLPVGPQQIKAEKNGFRSAVRQGVELSIGQEAVVNFRL